MMFETSLALWYVSPSRVMPSAALTAMTRAKPVRRESRLPAVMITVARPSRSRGASAGGSNGAAAPGVAGAAAGSSTVGSLIGTRRAVDPSRVGGHRRERSGGALAPPVLAVPPVAHLLDRQDRRCHAVEGLEVVHGGDVAGQRGIVTDRL